MLFCVSDGHIFFDVLNYCPLKIAKYDNFERGERHIWRVRYQLIQRGAPWICQICNINRDHLRHHLRDVIMGVGGRLQYHEMGRGRSIGGLAAIYSPSPSLDLVFSQISCRIFVPLLQSLRHEYFRYFPILQNILFLKIYVLPSAQAKKDMFKTLYSSCQNSSASVRIKSCEQSYKQQEFSGSLDRQTLRPHRQIREGAQLNNFV